MVKGVGGIMVKFVYSPLDHICDKNVWMWSDGDYCLRSTRNNNPIHESMIIAILYYSSVPSCQCHT